MILAWAGPFKLSLKYEVYPVCNQILIHPNYDG